MHILPYAIISVSAIVPVAFVRYDISLPRYTYPGSITEVGDDFE